MRAHLVGLVHRDPNPDWCPDAYVGKLWRLVAMLTGQGHEVILYGGPDCDTVAKEQVEVVRRSDRKRWFGDETWEETVYNLFDPMSASWVTMNSQTVTEITDRLGPGDIIGLTMGASQAAIQQAFPHRVVAEMGVGYSGVLQSTHKCFESHAWMHHVWGRQGIDDGRWFDTVIPNAFDPEDYLEQPRGGSDGYLLFMARNTPRKGTEVVRELAKRYRVVTAGQGGPIDGCEYAGVVRGDEKAKLLAGARAVLCPTQYIEPFGGIAVEAMLSGVPVIASGFGAFPELVLQGKTGMLCHTLGEFIAAVEWPHYWAPALTRAYAMGRFCLEVCGRQYDQWLNRLATLYGRGWYAA